MRAWRNAAHFSTLHAVNNIAPRKSKSFAEISDAMHRQSN